MPSTVKSTKAQKSYVYALGRRKTASARVRLYKSPSVPGVEGSLQLQVNNKPAEEYFPGDLAKSIYRKAFIVTDTLQKLSCSVRVVGSGKSGQLDATVHGIARALDKFSEGKFHTLLKSSGLLTRDPRAKERRKAGKGGKTRRSKQSPKR